MAVTAQSPRTGGHRSARLSVAHTAHLAALARVYYPAQLARLLGTSRETIAAALSNGQLLPATVRALAFAIDLLVRRRADERRPA